jgi:malonyl-CoA O-methyltransferase
MSFTNTHLVKKNFSKSATTYDAFAHVQRFACENLTQFIGRSCDAPLAGPIIEIGCGTGLLSEQLVKLFPDKPISFLDISENMIAQTRSKLKWRLNCKSPDLTFLITDAETFFNSTGTLGCTPKYSLIVSSFTFQWFTELENTIGKLIEHLDVGGHLIFSTPAAGSFSEWKSMSTELGLPFTANALPACDLFSSVAKRLNCRLHLEEFQFEERYLNSLEFFVGLKNLGASTSTVPADHSLTTTQLRHLIRHWNRRAEGGIKITYRIIQGCFTK